MAQFLKAFGKGAGGSLLWIDYDAYARAVFADNSIDWLSDPVRRAAVLEQAHAVVPSQVIAIDLADPFLDRDASPAELFEAEAPNAYLMTLLDALGHRLAERADIVLSLPSPGNLLAALGAACDTAPCFEDMDDIATSATGLLRRLSGKAVAGLRLTLSARTPLDPDEAEAMAPLVAVARHYGWTVAVAAKDLTVPVPDFCQALDADLCLFPDAPADSLSACGGAVIGGGLGAHYWCGPAPRIAAWPLMFGAIPPNTQPEEVVARMRALSALSA